MRNRNNNIIKSKFECILCGNNKLKLKEKLNTRAIRLTYKWFVKFDIDYLFSKYESINFYECERCSLRFFNPKIVGDNRYYQHLEKRNWYYRKEKYEYVFATKYINQKSAVLDVGCGEGNFSKYLHGSKFTGLELNKKAVKIGTSSGIDIREEDFKSHSRKNKNKYDVVTMFQLLEHVTSPGDFINYAINCLKTDGKIIIAVPSENSFMGKMQGNIYNLPPHHQSRWKDKALRNLAKIYSLQLISLHHEPLQEVNLKAYIRTIVEYNLTKFFRIKFSIFNDKLVYIAITILARFVSFFVQPFAKLKKHNVYGHSVIAVYRRH